MRPSRVLVAALTAAVALAAAGASSASPFRTGVFDPSAFAVFQPTVAFAHAKTAGASVVRLSVNWEQIAHTQPQTPADAANPAFSGYSWGAIDHQVAAAAAAGLSPILDLVGAPHWAMTSSFPGADSIPDPDAIGAFAKALALHFSGGTAGVPRISQFMFWNEPNLSTNVKPQTEVAALWYRAAVNQFAASVHAVHADNIVVAGALAPYENKPGPGISTTGLAPMTFIRDLLCMSDGAQPKPTCKTRVDIDVWGFHPYTYGPPSTHALSPNDIAAGDIPRAQALLRAAAKAGNLHASGALQFWVTEFSYDTSPPDPKGVPFGLQARWTSEALYEFWNDGISLVTWFLIRDQPLGKSPFQSGLYLPGSTIEQDRPKPTVTAFRFPFVAMPAAHGYRLWGRTPDGVRGNVVVEQKVGSHWKKLMTLRAGGSGIFGRTWATPLTTGTVRAVHGKDVSLAFALKEPKAKRYSPFGSG